MGTVPAMTFSDHSFMLCRCNYYRILIDTYTVVGFGAKFGSISKAIAFGYGVSLSWVGTKFGSGPNLEQVRVGSGQIWVGTKDYRPLGLEQVQVWSRPNLGWDQRPKTKSGASLGRIGTKFGSGPKVCILTVCDYWSSKQSMSNSDIIVHLVSYITVAVYVCVLFWIFELTLNMMM